MSSREARKSRERSLLAHFLKGEQIVTDVEDRETPDFEIAYEGRRIGIEVTELFQTPSADKLPLQAVASISNEIVQRAQNLYAKEGGPSLRVSVGFSQNNGLGAIRRDDASRELVEIVRSTIENNGDLAEWRPRHRRDLRAAEVFSYVHIYRHPEGIAPHWVVSAAGWVAPLEPGLIQSAIDQKAKLIESYLTAVPEVWLLIGALGRDPSQFFELDTRRLETGLRSPFHRTYYLDAFRAQAVRLHTSP